MDQENSFWKKLKIDRSHESIFTSWCFEVDKKLVWLVLLMLLVAVIMAISSGSANFVRTGGRVQWYVFFLRTMLFCSVGLLTMICISMTSKKTIMKIAWTDLIICFLLLIGTVLLPHKWNGSHRWLIISGFPKIMPSDLMKPGFLIITAWFISKMKSIYGKDMFDLKKTLFQVKTWSWAWYLAPLIIMMAIQFWHPDIGTMLLYLLTLGVMLLLAGMPMKQVWSLCGVGAGLGLLAFKLMSHVFARTSSFFGPVDPTSQVGIALRAIRNGGLFGAGDKAEIVEHLAMAESDFVLSVISENFGAIISCVLIVLLAMVVIHLLRQSRCVRDYFSSCAIGGAAAMFGFQACINIASTLRLMPAKGMTLPFISHGGSSLIAYCLLFGMILALMREDKWK